MTQTNQTVNELVEESHDMIGEFDDNEVIPSRYITKGIKRLNELINSYSGNAYSIPFVKKIEFQTVANQAEYTFSNEGSITPDVVSNRIVLFIRCKN